MIVCGPGWPIDLTPEQAKELIENKEVLYGPWIDFEEIERRCALIRANSDRSTEEIIEGN